jgi:hypothetical protein
VLQNDKAGLTDLFLSGSADGDGPHSRTPIGDRGAIAIATALKSNTKLRTLNLRAQHITAQGARALGDMLKTNTVLELLTLSDNAIGSDGVRTLSAPAARAGDEHGESRRGRKLSQMR